MDHVTAGVIAGIVFGIVSVLLMIPIPIPEKQSAMIAAFIGRFGTGFLVAVSDIGCAGWLRGAIIGVLLSLPPAIMTKRYAPILIIGIVGSAIIGYIVH